MLPFPGQGGNQALEDAGAILALCSNIPDKGVVGERLKMFDHVRRKRVSTLGFELLVVWRRRRSWHKN